MKPKRIQKTGEAELTIYWSDGSESKYTFQQLREVCPCAICKAEKMDNPSNLLPIYSESKYQLESITQVGTYAVQISWKDGHNTGIYTFEYLRSL